MSEKWTRRSALALLGSGGALFAWDSGGFTTTIADRETDVETKPDDLALLRIVGEDSGTRLLPGNTFETPFTIVFTNETNATIPEGEMDLTLDPLGTGLDDLELEDDDGDTPLTGTAGEFTNDGAFSVGDEARLRVENFRCETEFDIDVSARNDAGTSIELSRNTTIAGLDMADAFFVDVETAWSFGTAQGNRGIAFDGENTSDTLDIVAVEVGLDSAEAGNGREITKVRNEDPGEFGSLEERQSNTNFDETLLDLEGENLDVEEDNPVELDQNLELVPGGTAEFGLTQCRTANDQARGMNGGNATLRLVFSDGSVGIYEFENLNNQPG